MNKELLKNKINNFFGDIEYQFIEKCETRFKKFVEYDSETGSPMSNDWLCDYTAIGVDFFDSAINKFYFSLGDLSIDERLFIYNECTMALNDFKVRIEKIELEVFEFAPPYAEKIDKVEMLNGLKDCIKYCEEGIRDIFQQKEPMKEMEQYSNSINSQMQWDQKTEISELIYVLYHSKRIKVNGIPIEQKDLTEIFCKLFNTDIKTPTDLLNKTAKTFKKGEDGKTFISELNSILNDYIDKIRDKDSK